MLLLLVAIDQLGQERNFSCPLNQLETGFDILNKIVARGHTLVKASILDQNQSTTLPVEVFKGVSFLAAIQELKQEWESLLMPPAKELSFGNQERIQRLEQQVNLYAKWIANMERMVSQLKQLSQRAAYFANSIDKNVTTHNHFESICHKNETQLIKYRLLHQLAVERLIKVKT